MRMCRRFSRQYFDLLWEMTYKEFTVRYKRAIFGFLWVILNPLFQMIIMGVVFSNFINIPNYFVFLFSGLLPWQFFSLTVSKTTPCFVNERALLKKSNFCKEIIPLSLVFSNSLNLLISLFLFYIVLAFGKIIIVDFNLLNFVAGLTWIIVLTVGISLLTGSLNVRFRDVTFFIQTTLLLWFYVTPILYTIDQLPEKLQSFLALNPLSAPIQLIQSSIFSQQIVITPHILIINSALSLFLFGLGVFVFIKESPYFDDWL